MSDDQTLIKIAVFGVTMSLMCTIMISLLFVDVSNSEYDYDDITGYRNELIGFSGQTMINQTPWILTEVYTPYTVDLDPSTHTTNDGWLFGDAITTYPYLNQSANIKLDKGQKSTVPITYTNAVASYDKVSGQEFWAVIPIVSDIVKFFGGDPNTYTHVVANNWNYTGYRYVFDPTLPFSNNASSVDGSLSMVWYSFNGQEGLSGGLDIYGGDVLLASYSAIDIVSGYNTASGYATTYQLDFQGTILDLSIKFDESAITQGESLMQAWTNGDWSMAISSQSAGNFMDVKNSNSYSTTVGNVVDTFIKIYTFSVPSINNSWMDMILWLLVGLPMTVAMLCVSLRVISAIKVI